jgi:hypothetical protein
MPPFSAAAPPTTWSTVSRLFTFTSNGISSYTIVASVRSAASAQSSPKPSVSRGISAGTPGMLPTLT